MWTPSAGLPMLVSLAGYKPDQYAAHRSLHGTSFRDPEPVRDIAPSGVADLSAKELQSELRQAQMRQHPCTSRL